jgi:hypothetical protein
MVPATILDSSRKRAVLLEHLWFARTKPGNVAFRLFNGVGSHENHNFGAQSQRPLTRSLRFAGWVAPPPRKTRFRMDGQPFRGIGYLPASRP